MVKYLRKCISCGRYTLKKEVCPYCGAPTKNPHPPKFSLSDPYGEYRRKLKKEIMKKN